MRSVRRDVSEALCQPSEFLSRQTTERIRAKLPNGYCQLQISNWELKLDSGNTDNLLSMGEGVSCCRHIRTHPPKIENAK